MHGHNDTVHGHSDPTGVLNHTQGSVHGRHHSMVVHYNTQGHTGCAREIFIARPSRCIYASPGCILGSLLTKTITWLILTMLKTIQRLKLNRIAIYWLGFPLKVTSSSSKSSIIEGISRVRKINIFEWFSHEQEPRAPFSHLLLVLFEGFDKMHWKVKVLWLMPGNFRKLAHGASTILAILSKNFIFASQFWVWYC